ncbi:DUF1686 domain-containing protein [Encephalitozoon cuniculi]|nr:DUF1686 domain-containing protein [Encephalitozoon cuniculi]
MKQLSATIEKILKRIDRELVEHTRLGSGLWGAFSYAGTIYKVLFDDVIRNLKKKGLKDQKNLFKRKANINTVKKAKKLICDLTSNRCIVFPPVLVDSEGNVCGDCLDNSNLSLCRIYFFFKFNDKLESIYSELLGPFLDALQGVLPFTEGIYCSCTLDYIPEDARKFYTDQGTIPAGDLILDLLVEGSSMFPNNIIRGLSREARLLCISVFEECFKDACELFSKNLKEGIRNGLDGLRKSVTEISSKEERERLEGILSRAEGILKVLIAKVTIFKKKYERAISSFKKGEGSFAREFSELKGELKGVSSKAADLDSVVDEVQKALTQAFGPEFITSELFVLKEELEEVDGRMFGQEPIVDRTEKPPIQSDGISNLFRNLRLVFAAILVVQCILWYLEEEDSATRRAWNTGVYSLAVAGTIVYQVWRLAARYRDDGVIGMLREEWTAVGCIVPMAAGLLHGGVVRSSVYSMTVAGIGAVMMAVQGGVLCGMSLMQVCVVVCGNLVLGALCVAAVVFASVLLLVLNVGGGREKSVGEGIESTVFVMSMLVCVCRMCVDGTTTWCMGGGARKVPSGWMRST